jgi:hypothetical protein
MVTFCHMIINQQAQPLGRIPPLGSSPCLTAGAFAKDAGADFLLMGGAYGARTRRPRLVSAGARDVDI